MNFFAGWELHKREEEGVAEHYLHASFCEWMRLYPQVFLDSKHTLHNNVLPDGDLPSLRMLEKGIFVSCGSGNAGPTPSTIFNMAPWITTVGANTLNRELLAPVVLANGKIYRGSSLYKGNTLGNRKLPLVYGKTTSSNETTNLCNAGSLVLSDLGGEEGTMEMGLVVRGAGGARRILVNQPVDGEDLWTDCHFVPVTSVDWVADYLQFKPKRWVK